jgi:predicted kinase
MRKWMRDRLQGRKKKAATPSDQPAPPPLQPAYFEAAEQASDAVSNEPRTDPEANSAAGQDRSVAEDKLEDRNKDDRSPEPDSAPDSQEGAAEDRKVVAAGRASSARDSRGRRRRGGRGRGGRGREQAVAQAFAPAAVKGAIPEVAVEPGDEETGIGADRREADAAPATDDRAPAIPALTSRPPKGVVVLAIGLPGSGKSSWFKRHNVTPLSSDMVRTLLFDDVREQRFQDLVFSNLRSMLKARLIAKRPMNYVDATNLAPQERQHWIKLAKDYHYEVHAIFFDVPLEVCIERHERRDRVVPEDVMRRMAAKLKPPAFEEGFAKITVVRVKKKENEANGEVPAV